MSASASAEIIADLALCPFEAVKVRIQTNPQFARGMMVSFPSSLSHLAHPLPWSSI
jgi:solute carrier family 25 phosphate transporter 3